MFWQKIRSSTMFVISFVTCPCHLPITLPFALALLAGTPLAVWITQHSGWIYGIAAGVFFISLAFGFAWMGSLDENTGEICQPRFTRSICEPESHRN